MFLDADDEIVPCVLDESIEFLSKNKIDVGLFPYKIRQFCTTPDHMMGGAVFRICGR